MKTETLHQKALEIAARYRRSEAELIEILQQLDECKAYRQYECTSLYRYAVQYLKRSEDAALNFITVARKAREVPALQQEIERGTVTVSKIRKISSVITQENQSHWIELAKALPQKMLEREVAKVNPKAAVPEKTSYVSENRLRLELGVSEALLQMLRRAQDLEAQSQRKAVSLEETLQQVLECYLEKCDPVRKAERAAERDAQPLPVARRTAGAANNRRKALPTALVHQLNQCDRGKCAHENRTGVRCQDTRWLDFHHVLPLECGGKDTMENLVTLCQAHHRARHANEAAPVFPP